MRDEPFDLAFETRLRAALQRHVASAPGGFDAVAFARTVAVAEPRRPWGWHAPWAWPGLSLRPAVARLSLLVLLGALVLGLIAALLLAGGAQRRDSWLQLDLPGGGVLSDIASGPAGLVAIGTSSTGTRVWHSADGLTWAAATIAGGGSWPDAVRAATGWDGGYVAVGGTFVLTSPDGVEWTRLPADAVQVAPLAALSGDGMSDVVAFDGRLVAVGDLREPGGEGGSEPAIWTTTDAVTWRLVRPLEGAVPGFFGALRAIIPGGPGLVAVGETDWGAPVWVSGDGISWRRAQAAGWPSVARLGGVVRGPDGTLIAYGFGGKVWTSGDGMAWVLSADLSALAAPVGPDSVRVDSVALTTRGFVAVGTEEESVTAFVPPNSGGVVLVPRAGIVWTSRDGRSWQREPAAEPVGRFVSAAVLATPGGLYLSGQKISVDPADLSTWDSIPVLWYLPGGSVPDGPPARP